MTATKTDEYQACLQEMYGLRRFGIKLELSTIANMLRQLGDPQENFAAIHIAGTNGKGSIASALAAILEEAGYRVGLYTSPHLVHFNERIRINGREIADPEVVGAYRAVRQVDPGKRQPTFFEYTTAMAFYEFGRRGVQWAVIETGMGGRFDATNVVRPRLCVITNVSLEHRSYLGDTLAQIAGEKGGIIKPGVPVVTGVRQPAARSVIADLAASRKAPLYRRGRDFRTRRNPDGSFSYLGLRHRWPGMRTPLPGDHQVENAALVLAACEVLKLAGDRLPVERIRRGLARTRWPGRLEIVRREPLVILDGAHNLMAARRLAEYLAQHLEGRRLTLVAGILDDKPFEAMLKPLVPLCSRIVLTQPVIDRALPPERLLACVRRLGADAEIIAEVPRAVAHAIDTADRRDAVCVAGSLYTVGEARRFLLERGDLPEAAIGP